MNRSDRRRHLRGVTSRAVIAGLAVSAAGMALAPGVSHASSHREAPLTAADPDIDNTDTYAFNSPDKPNTVTLIANVKPFQLPAGGPIFDPFPKKDDVRYNINVDTNGDAKPDLTYRFTFTGGYKDKSTFLYNTGPVHNLSDASLNYLQHYRLDLVRPTGTTTLVANGVVPPDDVGKASMPDYASLRQQALKTGAGTDGTASFAGVADDPFFIDLRVFDLLYGGNMSETANPSLSGLNVSSLAVQVPKSVLKSAAGKDTSGVIGVYATTERKTVTINSDGSRSGTGNWVQVSRLGNPLVNEVVSSVALKDAFNNLPPAKDASTQGLIDRVNVPEVPKRIQKIYGLPAPATPRKDLFSVFLTGVKGLNQPSNVTPAEMLRLNTNTPVTANPNRLGVLAGDKGGFPNGRRLTDDVVDIELQTLEGALQPDGSVKLVQALAAGDKVNNNDVPFGSSFPYVALPHAGSNLGTGGTASTDNIPGGNGAAASGASAAGTLTMPTGGVATGGGGRAVPASDSTPVLPITVGALGVLLLGAGAWTLGRGRTASQL